MKHTKILQKKAILFLLFILVRTTGYAQSHSLHNSTNIEGDFTQEIIKSVGKELNIIENKGQIKNDVDGSVATEVLYTIPVQTGDIFITRRGLRIQHKNYLRNKGKNRMQQLKYRVELELIDCNPNAEIVTTGKSIFYRNYYFSASDYIKNVHDFESVKFINIYPNIDWVVYLVEGKLKYDFIVKPGGNPEDIQLLVRNADAILKSEIGELLIETPLNTYKESRPLSFQNGIPLNTQFSIDQDVISFNIDEYDQSKSLRIDPELKWGTMISNKQNNVGNSAVLDITENKNSGNVKLVGYNEIDQLSSVSKLSSSPSASTTSPNTYVMHLDSGRSPKWALYFPGTSTETSLITNCELNSKNELILSGVTSKSGLSKGSNVYQKTYSDSADFFIAKLDSSGTLDWLTYYGGPGVEILPDIVYLNGQNTYFTVSTGFENNPDYLKVNSADEIVLFGQTSSSSNMANSSNPILNYQGVSNGNVIAKFKSSDGSIIWSSYLYGGNNSNTYERLTQLLIDHADNIYVLGETKSDSVVYKADNENVSDISLIVMKIDNSGVYKWGRFLNPGQGKFMYVNGATVSVDNKLLIVGSTNNDTFNIQGRREGAGSGKGYDGYLMQLDTSMDIEWYSFQWADGFDKMWRVSQKPSGVILTSNLFFGGNFFKACYDTTNRYTNISGNSFKLAVMEFSSNGMWLNTKRFPGSNLEMSANSRLLYSHYYDGFYTTGIIKGTTDSFVTTTAFDKTSDKAKTVGNLMFFKTQYDSLLRNTHNRDEAICFNQPLILKPSSTKSPFTAQKDLIHSWSPAGLFNQQKTNNDSAMTLNITKDTMVVYRVADACMWDTMHISITVLPTIRDTIKSKVCAGDSVIFKDGTVFRNISRDTFYSITYQNTSGCDSIEYYSIGIYPSSHDSVFVSICRGDAYVFPDQTEYININTDTFHRNAFTNRYGCDSIITTFVNVKFTIGDTIKKVACTEFTWNDSTLQREGIHEQILTGRDGCDSFAYLNLVLNQYDTTYYRSSCTDYNWEGITYDSSGLYQVKYTTYLGCDSTLNLNLTIGTYYDTSNVTSCFSHVWNSRKLTMSGTYSDTFKSFVGCDSITTLNLKILNVDTSVSTTRTSLVSNSLNSTYQWLDCSNTHLPIANETAQRFYPTEDGIYAVDITTDDGCRDTSECIEIDILTHSELSVNTLVSQSKLYPNPTSGNLHVVLQQYSKDVHVYVSDAVGQLVKQISLGDGKDFKFDLDEPSGVYLIRISVDNQNKGNHIITVN